jgi:hypothetical protein
VNPPVLRHDLRTRAQKKVIGVREKYLKVEFVRYWEIDAPQSGLCRHGHKDRGLNPPMKGGEIEGSCFRPRIGGDGGAGEATI